MSTIPKDNLDKIDVEAEALCQCGMTIIQCSNKRHFKQGAEFGYQLATDGREELEKENERLKALIKDAYYYRTGGPRDDHGWQQFKSANKL